MYEGPANEDFRSVLMWPPVFGAERRKKGTDKNVLDDGGE